MVDFGSEQQAGAAFFSPRALLVALFFFLPLVSPLFFLWLNLLLAVPVFCFLQIASNEKLALTQLRNSLFLCGGGALLLGQLGAFSFSLIMLPLGYSLYRSAQYKRSPAAAGAVGLVAFGLSWLVSWGVYNAATDVDLYAALLEVLDGTLVQLAQLYEKQLQLEPEVLYNVLAWITKLRTVILPLLLPGLLAVTAVLTVWMNMIVGNYFLRKLQPEREVWAEFRCWKLPDNFVWWLILSVVWVLSGFGSEGVRGGGYCLLLTTMVIYFLQGMAVFVHLLYRWNISLLWRVILYVIAVHAYGLVLLAVVGVADIWADFRKLAPSSEAG